MSADTPFTPEQLADLKELDFFTKPVQICKVIATGIECTAPAMQVGTKACCGQQIEICDAHADDFQASDNYVRCAKCGHRTRFRSLYRFASIGHRL